MPFISVFIVMATCVWATSLPPQPVCQITAVVVDHEDNGLLIKITEPGLRIKEGYDKERTCEFYEIGKQLRVAIIQDADQVILRQLETGATIVGHIQYIGDEFSVGYFLTDIRVIEN